MTNRAAHPSKIRSMTEGPLWKEILLFSLPLMLSQVLQVLFNMADVAVIGRFSGPAALGAVGSTTILVSLFTGFLIGIGSGVNVRIAQYYGAKCSQDIREALHTSLILCFFSGVLICLLCLFFAHGMLSILNTKDELMEGAVLYFKIYALGMPALGLFNFGNAVLSAIGDTKRPLYYLSAAGILNFALNLFFVIACRLDVAGVALASIISQYLSAFLILRQLLREKGDWQLRLKELRLNRNKAIGILQLGLPAGFQNVIFAIANLFIQAGVNSFDAVMVAGNSAAANADALIYNVMAALYTACSSFMGQNWGAGKRNRVLKSYFISLGYSFGIGAILGLALILFGESFLALFTKDAAVIEAGMRRLVIMGFSYALSAFMDCTIAASRGIGKSLAPTIIVILGSCVFRVVWVYTVFAHFRTIPALYLLYSFSWTITAAAEIIYFAKSYRKLTLSQTKALPIR